MASITHRERVLAALNHEATDRVPIDFGGTQVSTIFHTAYDALKQQLGMTHPTRTFSDIRRIAMPDDEMLERFDVDTRFLSTGGTYIAKQRIDDTTVIDEWGITWKRAEDGNPMAVEGPFPEPDLAALDGFDWPDPEDDVFIDGLRAEADRLRQTDCAIILNIGTGFGKFIYLFNCFIYICS